MIRHMLGVSIHKAWVAAYMGKFAVSLVARAVTHDLSKFSCTEAKGFATLRRILSTEPYGGLRYKEALKSPCVRQHYTRNRHHPEHFSDGIAGMTLLDVVEMWCDWKAAIRRSPGGDLGTSLNHNRGRFGEPGLFRILRNELEKCGR